MTDSLIEMLEAEMNKTVALMLMQKFVKDEQFEAAMSSQFAYLYWCDEFSRLYSEHFEAYWTVRDAARYGK